MILLRNIMNTSVMLPNLIVFSMIALRIDKT